MYNTNKLLLLLGPQVLGNRTLRAPFLKSQSHNTKKVYGKRCNGITSAKIWANGRQLELVVQDLIDE